MPRLTISWDNVRREGNTTHSEAVNQLKTVKRFEVRRSASVLVSQSQIRRALGEPGIRLNGWGVQRTPPMEEIGPSPGLPALSTLLHAATMEEPSLHDGSAAPDTGLGLLADAAALPMRSPAPSSPTDLFLLDAGPPQLNDSASSGILMDVTMDTLYEALDDVDTGPLPELLDVAWGSSEASLNQQLQVVACLLRRFAKFTATACNRDSSCGSACRRTFSFSDVYRRLACCCVAVVKCDTIKRPAAAV